MGYREAEILENTQISSGIYRMRVPRAQDDVHAGQFYMLRCLDANVLLPRAISVCDCDSDTILFLYQVVGEGTAELSRLSAGEPLALTGPLGNGFPLSELSGHVALVGGGIGIAPLYYTARSLQQLGISVDALLGFRDQSVLTGSFEEVCSTVRVATETGREGQKGFVTELLDPSAYSAVLVCGPEPMMQAVTQLCMKANTPVYVSLENKMACGIGACLVCTCTDQEGKNHRTCTDGPVFRGEDIRFDA